MEEGHLRSDHVHMLISIPPKHSVAQTVGFIKGKSAIHIARNYLGRRSNFTGQHFRARGYWVSTVGKDEQTVRGVYPEPGAGGPASRPAQHFQVIATFRWRLVSNRFERFTSFQASGFAGGHDFAMTVVTVVTVVTL